MKARKPLTLEAVTAAVLANDLVPETVYHPLHGGATTFREKFEAEGLPIYVHNRRRCVRPSELKAFIAERAKLANPEAVGALLAAKPALASVLSAPKRKMEGGR